MALELIGALMAAAALGLFAWAIRRKLTGLPKWTVPAAAGLGLVATTVGLEYGWYARVSAELPPQVEVIEVQDEAMPLRPWTYLWPIRMRFVALDHRKTVVHPQDAALRIVTLYSFARWRTPDEGLMAVDCAANRRVMVTEGVEITPEGTLKGADWQAVDPVDKLQEAACREV